jgi:hypothetical protein
MRPHFSQLIRTVKPEFMSEIHGENMPYQYDLWAS